MQYFTEKTIHGQVLNREECPRTGWEGRVRSDLDATRRLGELKSEFVESPPLRISSSPPLRIEVAAHCTAHFLLTRDFKGPWHCPRLTSENNMEMLVLTSNKSSQVIRNDISD